jgi:hypothetical protein
MRLDAKFCSDHCRYVAHGEKRAQPAWLRMLEQRLKRHAPKAAVSYRLGLVVELETWYYPPRDRESLRATGEYRLDPTFSLVPFESPIVPRADLYGVVFYESNGRALRTPPELAGGVEVYPLRRRRLSDGDSE